MKPMYSSTSVIRTVQLRGPPKSILVHLYYILYDVQLLNISVIQTPLSPERVQIIEVLLYSDLIHMYVHVFI